MMVEFNYREHLTSLSVVSSKVGLLQALLSLQFQNDPQLLVE
jgi:hypothetical protein